MNNNRIVTQVAPVKPLKIEPPQIPEKKTKKRGDLKKMAESYLRVCGGSPSLDGFRRWANVNYKDHGYSDGSLSGTLCGILRKENAVRTLKARDEKAKTESLTPSQLLAIGHLAKGLGGLERLLLGIETLKQLQVK